MRKLSIVLVAFMAIGFAGSASALSIVDTPKTISGFLTSADVSFDLTNDERITMQVSVNHGKVGRVRVGVTSDGGDARTLSGYGAMSGPDVNVSRIRVRGDGQVDFFFKESFFKWYVRAGKKSDPFYVEYNDLAAGDVVTVTGFRHWIFGSFGSTSTTIVPEPTPAVLVGLGMLGLAVAGRRR